MPFAVTTALHHVLLRPHGAVVPLASSHEHLLALLEGAATAEDGSLPSAPSGSPARVLAEDDNAILVAVHADRDGDIVGWVPAGWIVKTDAPPSGF